MDITSRAIEVTGTIDKQQNLILDEPLHIRGEKKVRVIILMPEEHGNENSDIKESEWLYAASRNPAFDFLKDEEEDIYTIDDGTSFS
ncbi:MAG: hypothetical protein GY940_01140 [bacterium]|nr:hypothetical protein [bacterium]